MHVAGREARTIEGRLSKELWIVGEQLFGRRHGDLSRGSSCCAAPSNKPAAAELGARFLPMERNYPALARWIGRIEALPGYDRTYPPHWRER